LLYYFEPKGESVMALKTGDEYVASIKSLGLEANVMGKKTGNLVEHPLVQPSVRAVAAPYDCAHHKAPKI
jgi:4-hydroxybutyryl-CoA dehydratase/vinylacetyl-CoA-Delta-isomerase